MIDLHGHFLPEVDDGAKDVSESVAMLSSCYADGIKICAATPHLVLHSEEDIAYFLEIRQDAISTLQAELTKCKTDAPELLYGAEIYLDNDISKYNGLEKLCITGTRLLLVELSEMKWDPAYADWIYGLTVKGIRPILAHVERYSYFDRLYDELSAVDVIYQVNADTVLSVRGRLFLADLYKGSKPVIVAGDMHNASRRKNRMADAKKALGLFRRGVAADVFNDTAAELMAK